MWWHAQNPDFVFRRNGRVHLNQRERQFSRLLSAEVCASAVVMPDTPCSEIVWRVLATHSIRHFPLLFPSRASRCAITFEQDSTLYDVHTTTKSPNEAFLRRHPRRYAAHDWIGVVRWIASCRRVAQLELLSFQTVRSEWRYKDACTLDRIGRRAGQHRANVPHSRAACSSDAPGAAEFDDSVRILGKNTFLSGRRVLKTGEAVVRDRTGTGRDAVVLVA